MSDFGHICVYPQYMVCGQVIETLVPMWFEEKPDRMRLWLRVEPLSLRLFTFGPLMAAEWNFKAFRIIKFIPHVSKQIELGPSRVRKIISDNHKCII